MPERGWRWLHNFVDSFYPAWQQQQTSGGSLHGTCFPGFFAGFAATLYCCCSCWCRRIILTIEYKEGGRLNTRGYRAQHDFNPAWLKATWYSSEKARLETSRFKEGCVKCVLLYYPIVLNSRVLLMFSETGFVSKAVNETIDAKSRPRIETETR